MMTDGKIEQLSTESPGVRNAMRHFDAGLRIRRLEEALRKIRDGLADTGSTPGQRMTLITKADAHAIACDALKSE